MLTVLNIISRDFRGISPLGTSTAFLANLMWGSARVNVLESVKPLEVPNYNHDYIWAMT